MMRVWFPPPETLKHIDIKKIPESLSANTFFSAKALAAHVNANSRIMMECIWSNLTFPFVISCFTQSSAGWEAAKNAPKVPASIRQKIRHQNAVLFPTWYKYDENNDEMNDKITLICSDGGCHPWTEQSSGISWVGVHGVDQICVVIIRAYKVAVRHSSLPVMGIGFQVLLSYADRAVAEMEAIEHHQLNHQSFKKGPFAVVSVVRNPDNHGSSSETLWAASGEEQCIKLLVDKLKDASDFSYNETLKAAVSAIKILFSNNLKDDDVLVRVVRKSDGQTTEVWGRGLREIWPLPPPRSIAATIAS